MSPSTATRCLRKQAQRRNAFHQESRAGTPRGEPARAKAEPPNAKDKKGASAKVDLEDNAEVDESEAKGEVPILKERKARFCEGCQSKLS